MADVVIAARHSKGEGESICHADCFTLLDIFDVEIRPLGTDRVAEIYGKIELNYSCGIWDLYNREKAEAEKICLPGAISLKHPPVAVQAHDRFYITFDLKGDFEQLGEDDCVSWMPGYPEPDNSKYNKLLIEEFKGQKFSLAISYAVYTRALVADVELKVLEGDEICDARIHGTVTAYAKRIMDVLPKASLPRHAPKTNIEGFKSVLFSVKPEDHVSAGVCESGLKIPLSKSIICLPYQSGLYIHVDLFSFPDVPIASGVVRCLPESSGQYVGIIPGHGGRAIEVMFTVWPYPEHPETAKEWKLCMSGLKDR